MIFSQAIGIYYYSAPLPITPPSGQYWLPLATTSVPTTIRFTACAWSRSRSEWIVGGTGRTVVLSNDGVIWSTSTGLSTKIATDDYITCIIWNDVHNWYIAGTNYGKIVTSPDGLTWTLQTTPFDQYSWIMDIDWIEQLGQYVITGYYTQPSGTYIEGQRLATSNDGISWVNRSSRISASLAGTNYKECFASAYGANTLCVTGINGTSSKISTSTDGGITWVARTPTGMTYSMRGIVWTGTRFVVCGSNGRSMISPDGITWTSNTAAYSAAVGTGSNTQVIDWNGYQLFSLSGGAATSPDGLTWTSVSSLSTILSTIYMRCVTHSDTQYCIVGDSASILLSQPSI